MHPSIRRPKNEQVEVELGVKIAAKLRAFLNVTFIYEGMRAPNDVSMSGLLVAVEKSDDGRGGGPHRLEGRPISYCLLRYCLRSRYNMKNLQS